MLGQAAVPRRLPDGLLPRGRADQVHHSRGGSGAHPRPARSGRDRRAAHFSRPGRRRRENTAILLMKAGRLFLFRNLNRASARASISYSAPPPSATVLAGLPDGNLVSTINSHSTSLVWPGRVNVTVPASALITINSQSS